MREATTPLPDLAPSAREKFTGRVLPFLLFAALLLLIPALGPSRSMLSLLSAIGINMVFALSYNMLLGQTGLLSFGHAVYFGLGGYAAMHGMNWIEAASYDGGFWANFPVFCLPILGFAGGALAGAIIGWPSCRSADVPFAMISLGIAELVAAAGFMFVSIFGGEEGITGDRMNGIAAFGLSLGPVSEVYWFIAFWTFAATALMYGFTRTPLGRIAQATRDNAERVEFIGYDPRRVRYLVFVAAGGFAGLAGGMAAVNFEIFTPESLSVIPSGLVLLMAYIGGARYFAGPILGAMLLTYMQSNLSDFTEAWLLYLGLLFIGVVMFAPGGLAGIVAGVATGLSAPDRGQRLGLWLRMMLAGLVAFVGAVILIEIAVRAQHGFGEQFHFLGLTLNPGGPMAWLLALGLLAAGGIGLRRMGDKP